MKKLNVWKHTVSGLLALLIVAGAVPVTNNGGGLLTGETAITAQAAASSFTEKKVSDHNGLSSALNTSDSNKSGAYRKYYSVWRYHCQGNKNT